MISRRRLLTGAGALGLAATLAACSGEPNIARPTVSPSGSITEQLDQVLTTIADGNSNFGVQLTDLVSGGRYSFNGTYASQSASMAKPMIVAMALRRARSEGTELSPENVEHARKAITQSDNDSATALWQYAGYQTYQPTATMMGMTNTHLDQNKPDQWSWTWTTPQDQVQLVNTLATGDTAALSNADCKFIYDLMGEVQQDQTWGVGEPGSADVTTHLKNGWVQFKSTDGLWAVNSMGDLKGEGRDYQLCVMTRVPDFDTGRAVTNEVGKWVFNILGSGNL